MATEKKEAKTPYIAQMAHFYFAPELRSIFTIFYLIVFGFFALYYLDNFLLALKFLWYVTSGVTTLQGTAFLFTGVIFVLCLILPFSASLYSLFVLHAIWKKQTWSSYLKWVVTAILALGTIFIVIVTDEGSRMAARADSMRSFVEDAGLSGRI